MAGFLFLLPVYVVLVIATKAWTSLSSVGTRLATLIRPAVDAGRRRVDGGVGSFSDPDLDCVRVAGTVLRLSMPSTRASNGSSSSTSPGYSTYKAMAEDKLHQRTGTLPYASVLVRGDLGWQPAFLIEQDAEGHCVLFVPRAPDTSAGSVLLATTRSTAVHAGDHGEPARRLLEDDGQGTAGNGSRASDPLNRDDLYDGISGDVAVSRYVLRHRESVRRDGPRSLEMPSARTSMPRSDARSSPSPIDSRPARSPGGTGGGDFGPRRRPAR